MAVPEPITVSATVLAQLFLYLDSLRVDVNAFLRSLDIEPETVRSPDAYIPIETYLRIQDGAAEYVNDPYLGLHMGEFAQPANWSILGYLMMNCKTLGEAFEKWSLPSHHWQPDYRAHGVRPGQSAGDLFHATACAADVAALFRRHLFEQRAPGADSLRPAA